MPRLIHQLALDKCPHCNVDIPSLRQTSSFFTDSYDGFRRYWKTYSCTRCGGVVTAASNHAEDGDVHESFPKSPSVHESIPELARSFLQQALDSLHAPAGAVMLAASAIDAMLKAKSYKNGTLFERINKAANDHLITKEMAEWAHNVRLDANEPRHADEDVSLPDGEDARRSIEFTFALAEFLFVLPSKVSRGLKEAENAKEVEKSKGNT